MTRRAPARAGGVLAISIALATACGARDDESSERTASSEPARAPSAERSLPLVLPSTSGALGPAMGHVVGDVRTPGRRLADVDACESCHVDAADGFRQSAHGHASFDNPLYRVAVERLARERGTAATRVCGSCHDVALLVDGALDVPVAPEDPRARAGISCRSCHGFTAATVDGNGSWTLDASEIPLPRDGDPASVEAHRARVAPKVLRDVDLCASCHRSFLNGASGNAHHLVGQDDVTSWARSPYAGSLGDRVDEELPPADCRGCHMPREAVRQGDAAAKNGTLASHRFLGGHTQLAAMRGDAETVTKIAERMQRAIALYVVPLAPSARGDVRFDVVVRNLAVGHAFPAGVKDAQDTWLEVRVRDDRGAVVLEAGTDQALTGADPSAHQLASYAAGEDGTRKRERETHLFRATVWDATIPPRDASATRFVGQVPEAAKRPLLIEAQLRHRSRSLELQDVACRESKTPRGARFAEVSGLSPCVPQPINTLARDERRLGEVGAPDFDREIAHALGLLRGVSEAANEAAAPLARAYPLAASDRQRAIVLSLEARLAVREGRTEDALALANRAEELVPHHPALARVRGDAHRHAWRLEDAAREYRRVWESSPRDDAAASDLAVSLAGSGAARGALSVAAAGLTLQPRSTDLLRVQALARDALGAHSEEAWTHFLATRPPDEAPRVRAKCSARVPGCADERMPVHVHALRPASPKDVLAKRP